MVKQTTHNRWSLSSILSGPTKEQYNRKQYMSKDTKQQELEESQAIDVAMKKFLADGGVVQQIARGISGVEEGSPQAAWGRPKKKEK